MSIIQPLSRDLTFGRNNKLLEKILVRIDRVLNRYVTSRYAWSQPKRRQAQALTQLQKSPTTASSPS